MQTNKNRTDADPINNSDLEGVIRFGFKKMLEKVDGVLPAKVVKYDRATNRVQVQVLINSIGTSGEQVAGKNIASIPVFLFGGGGFFVSFPLNTGDLGWVVACDRDISIFLQKYSAAGFAVETLKDFGGSFFLPDIMTNYTISEEDASNAVIQNIDGSVKISLSNNSVNIEAPTVNVISPSVNIESSTMVSMTTPILYVDGSIEATGPITPDVPPL